MTFSQQPPEEMLSAIIDASPIGMILANREGKIVFSNEKAEKIFGYTRAQFLNLSVNQLIPEQLREFHNKVQTEFKHNPSPRAMDYGRILPALTKDGSEIQVQLGLSPIEEKLCHCVLISILEMSNQIIKVASYHDALTGLANRNLFKEIGNNLRNLAIRNKTGLSLFFVDLDGFKGVNDQFGHAAGDMVLCEVANILNSSLRKNDIASRIGGDEFVMCFYGADNIKHLKAMARGLIEKISAIKEIDGFNIDINASIGAINAARPENMSLEDMTKAADKLMYEAKKAGKGRVVAKKIE